MFQISLFLVLLQLAATRPRSGERVPPTEEDLIGGFFWKPKKPGKRSVPEASTEAPEDNAAFFFRPRFGARYGKRSAGLPDIPHKRPTNQLAGFFVKPKRPRGRRAVGESSTEGPQDTFFFRPKFGKRSAVRTQDAILSQEDGASGFFFKPNKPGDSLNGGSEERGTETSGEGPGFLSKRKHDSKRAVEQGTESSEDGAAGFFFRPKFG